MVPGGLQDAAWPEEPLFSASPGPAGHLFAQDLAKKGERRKDGPYSKSWENVKLGEQQHRLVMLC